MDKYRFFFQKKNTDNIMEQTKTRPQQTWKFKMIRSYRENFHLIYFLHLVEKHLLSAWSESEVFISLVLISTKNKKDHFFNPGDVTVMTSLQLAKPVTQLQQKLENRSKLKILQNKTNIKVNCLILIKMFHEIFWMKD